MHALRTIDRATRRARFFLGLAAILAGCKREPPPPSPGPSASAPAQLAAKLAGVPARVIWVAFAPDGASMLVFERRPAKDENATAFGTFAVSRGLADGSAAKDLFASGDVVLTAGPLGNGVVTLQRPPTAEEKGEPREEGETDDDRYRRQIEAAEKTALYRTVDGAAPVRVSPAGRRCVNLVWEQGGRWIAFSLAPDADRPLRRRLAPGDEETHVLGAKPGEELTLTYKGLVRGISPDGARVLVRRHVETPDAGAPRRRRDEPAPSDHAKALVMITVKDQVAADLPTSLAVDGAAIDTATLVPGFMGDGLVFRSAKGELYRSALDGSSALRVAGSLPDAADAGSKLTERRLLGPKGTPFELREEAGAVVLSSLAKPGAPEPIARFEGPLEGLGDVWFDAAEKHAALAVLSDTSRDGLFDASQDDAEIFVVGLGSAGPGALTFGRAKVSPLADEIRPKVAAAAGIPESAVTIVPKNGSVQATAELPWVDGEEAKALLRRALTAARAIKAAVPQKTIAVQVRMGRIDLQVVDLDDGKVPRHLFVFAPGIAASDPEQLTLVHRKPAGLTSGRTVTLSGELENTGKDPTPPIEVYAATMTGPFDARDRHEVKEVLGVIAPGKSVKYSLVVVDTDYWSIPHASFRAEGKGLAVLNQYAYEHTLDTLQRVLDLHARHGVWIEHQEGRGDVNFVVRLTAEQAALAEGPREALFRSIAAPLAEHQKFDRDSPFGDHLVFAAPGGGGWRMELGKKTKRFEGAAELQRKALRAR